INMRYNRQPPGRVILTEVSMQFYRGHVSDCASGSERALCEPLEMRLLMAASVRRGILRIVGTAEGDDISVSVTRTKIFVTTNGSSKTFSPTGIKLVRIEGGAGDDWLGITGKLPALMIGGSGDDTIAGGAAADFLDGGDDADLLD